MANGNQSSDELKYGSALVIALVGLIVPMILVIFLAWRNWDSKEIAAVIGIFTGLTGTVVGSFLGVQIGASGKRDAENLAHRALGALPPEKAQEVLQG